MLIVLAVYHLGIELASTLAPDVTIHFAQSFYGLSVNEGVPQFAYMLKAMGMYALFTGGLVAVALSDPQRHRSIVIAVAALLFMRATTRLLFFDVLEEAFALTWAQNLLNVIFLLGKGGLLLWAIGPAEAPAPVPLQSDWAEPPVRARPPLLPVGALSSASRRLAAASRRMTNPLASASGVH